MNDILEIEIENALDAYERLGDFDTIEDLISQFNKDNPIPYDELAPEIGLRLKSFLRELGFEKKC